MSAVLPPQLRAETHPLQMFSVADLLRDTHIGGDELFDFCESVTDEKANNPTAAPTEDIPGLTFDPVSLVEVNLPLSLDAVRTNHHEMPPRNGAVQLPSGTESLAMTAGTVREKRILGQKDAHPGCESK